MQSRLSEGQWHGARLIAVTPSEPDVLAADLRREPQSVAFVCDPKREAYRQLDLGRGRWRMFVQPRVLGHYLSRMARGWMPRRPKPGEDLLQLGGDFVFDQHHRLVYAHRSEDVADRPAIADLLAAVRSLPESSPEAT